MNWLSKILNGLKDWLKDTVPKETPKMESPKLIDVYEEPKVGKEIYATDEDDARLKMAELAWKSNKIIVGSVEWGNNGGIMKIEAVSEPKNELREMAENLKKFDAIDHVESQNVKTPTEDEIRELAYYIWLETYGDSQWCWEEALRRLGIQK